jgi:adenylate kinase
MLSKEYHIPTASTGAMLRREIAQGTPLGKEAAGHMAAGGFVPDELVLRIISAWMDDNGNAEAFILDGFPRTVSQAQALEEDLQRRQRPLDFAFLFELPESEILQRILHRLTCDACGATFGEKLHSLEVGDFCPRCKKGKLGHRDDDTEATLKHRLQIYEEKTLPIADFYRKRGILREYDAGLSAEALFGRLQDVLTDKGGNA